MEHTLIERKILLDDVNPVDLFGVNDDNLAVIKRAYPDVKLIARGNVLKLYGAPRAIDDIIIVVQNLIREVRKFGPLEADRLSDLLQAPPAPPESEPQAANPDILLTSSSGVTIRARTEGQRRIVTATERSDVVFAVGPAGSGKTYVAVAMAVRALKNKQVKKIVLVRPAVEAGESLGFLPGDLREKIDPYLRPLYDALEDMIHFEKLKMFLEKNIIEVAPLAYMRGRTLSNAFIILDEAQNTTEMQMKMFLTRMGLNSQVIVTGDITQIDLPRSQRSGLLQCVRILQNIKGIEFVFMSETDVVRHTVIRYILRAYDAEDQRKHPNEVKKLDGPSGPEGNPS